MNRTLQYIDRQKNKLMILVKRQYWVGDHSQFLKVLSDDLFSYLCLRMCFHEQLCVFIFFICVYVYSYEFVCIYICVIICIHVYSYDTMGILVFFPGWVILVSQQGKRDYPSSGPRAVLSWRAYFPVVFSDIRLLSVCILCKLVVQKVIII